MKSIKYLPVCLLALTFLYSACKKDDNGDNEKPYIEMLGYASINHSLGMPYNDAGAIAWDITMEGDTVDISDRLVVDNKVNVNTAGTYYVTYNVSDEAGNDADERKRTVHVVIGK
ncbi:MAG: immunoglobulin-like domain-containing protein [Bacteroidales bacterium]|nr:immunoglobulin-like domain-containing protein [Bacteroidales bacterium]